MSEVSCRVFDLAQVAAHASGRTASGFLADLSVSPSTVHDRSAFMPWADFVALCERMRVAVGDGDGLRRVGRLAVRGAARNRLSEIAGYLGGPAAVYAAAVEWWAPSLFRNVQFDRAEIGRDQLRINIVIPAEFAPNPGFFELAHGVLETLPHYIGLGAAALDVDLHPRHGRYRVALPPGHGVGQRLRRLGTILSSSRATVKQLAEQERLLYRRDVELARQQQDFRRIAEAVPDGVVIHRGGEIVYANSEFVRCLGSAVHPGASLLDMVLDEDVKSCRRLLSYQPRDTERPRAKELRFKRGSGSVNLEIMVGQSIDFAGHSAQLLVARDVTERRAVAAQLSMIDRMTSLGTLAAGVAHEVNNPITYVLGNLRMAEREVEQLGPDSPADVDRARLQQLLTTAREGAEQIKTIVSDLKEFASPGDMPIGGLEVNKALDSTLGLLGSKLGGRVTVERDPSKPLHVSASQARLSQVFLNLLLNAVDAVDQRAGAGQIVVRTFAKHDDRVVVIEVEDDGVGIPPSNRRRIFDPFFTTKATGSTGLGLSISHTIIQSMGGELDVDSQPGLGSTFRIRLPAVKAPAPSRSSRPPPPEHKTAS